MTIPIAHQLAAAFTDQWLSIPQKHSISQKDAKYRKSQEKMYIKQ